MMIFADKAQLEQVVMNLVVNARDAMPEGGILKLETASIPGEGLPSGLDVARSKPHVRLRVSDNGSGMSAEVRRHLFEPFFTTKENGTGLGLAMVYGIVKQSQGAITVSSEVGKGSTVDIFFPCFINPQVVKQSYPGRDLRNLQVLIVEDEDAIRQVYCESLALEGYRVFAAVNGSEALQLLETNGPFDLLLTDIVMPGMNGIQLAAEVVQR
jgi:two-component system cell cycle sensor histidine kinase/response regulator CckA